MGQAGAAMHDHSHDASAHHDGHHHREGAACRGAHTSGADARVKDPVCGMLVEPERAQHRAVHEGATYHFCSAGCRTKFLTDPARYLAPEAKRAPEPAPAGTTYTCPMHPEIRQIGPGSCPICGMALEPELASAEAAPNPELADMQRRFWVGLAFTVPVFVLEMGGHLTGLSALLGHQRANWLQLVLAVPVVLWAGLPFFV